MGIVNEIRSYGEDLKDEKFVKKVLRSLGAKFHGVVVAIDEAKDLTHLSLNDKAFQESGNILKDKNGSANE